MERDFILDPRPANYIVEMVEVPEESRPGYAFYRVRKITGRVRAKSPGMLVFRLPFRCAQGRSG